MKENNNGVFCRKVANPKDIIVGKIELPPISEEVKRVIRRSKIESIQGLIGPDSQSFRQKMVEDYWSRR